MAGDASGDDLCGGYSPFEPTETPRSDALAALQPPAPAPAPVAVVSAAAVSSCNVSDSTSAHEASPPGAIVTSNRGGSSRLIGLSEGKKPRQVHEGAPTANSCDTGTGGRGKPT